jgi:hypothetical protein
MTKKKEIEEMLRKNISDSMANLMDIQEIVTRYKVESYITIAQEADKIIPALRELENLFPSLECKECGAEMTEAYTCDDPLCDSKGKTQF